MSVKCTTCDKSCSFRKEPFSSDYAALLARHNALKEAVAWEMETYMFWEFGRTYTLIANDEALENMFAARTEVDRLLAEGEG